jgi:hypothetical protein
MNIRLEFRHESTQCIFTVQDELSINIDKIGFDIPGFADYFYVQIGGWLAIIGQDDLLYAVCDPVEFASDMELVEAFDKFKAFYGDKLGEIEATDRPRT